MEHHVAIITFLRKSDTNHPHGLSVKYADYKKNKLQKNNSGPKVYHRSLCYGRGRFPS